MVFVEFCALRLFSWTDLRRTSSLIVVIFPILAFCCIAIVTIPRILLVISNSILFEKLVEVIESISITCLETVSSKLSHFTLSHLLYLFHLCRGKLYLSSIDGIRAST